MSKFLAFIFAVAISFNTIAADNKPDTKLVTEYFEMSKVDQVVNTTIDTYMQQFSQMEAFKDLSAADHAALKKIMTDAVGWETIKPQMTTLIKNVYTRDEIKAAIAFMRSKHGASMASKEAEYSRQMAMILARNFEIALAKCAEHASAIQQEKLAEKQ